jgi:phosphate transport system substrate-binding protein
MKRKSETAIVAIIISMSLLIGCLGGSDKPYLIQTGSSTILPLAGAWAEEFDDAYIAVSGGGSSHGLNALIKGETDLGDASRLLKSKDYEKVGGNGDLVNEDGTASGPAPTGVWPHKWIVAFDVLVVVINAKNNWAGELDYDQLYEIFTDDDPAVYWSEVSGLSSAPRKKIEIYAPDEGSGTFDYFFESIIPNWGKDDQQANARLYENDKVYQPTSDDNVILNAISDNEYAIGFFGFAYYIDNPGKIKAVSVAVPGGEHVEPLFESVAEYSLARPLHIYTDGIPEKGNVINKYLVYILSEAGQDIVPQVGYIGISLVNQSIVDDQLMKLEQD